MGETGWLADVIAALPFAAGWVWGKIVVAAQLVRGAAVAGYRAAIQERQR